MKMIFRYNDNRIAYGSTADLIARRWENRALFSVITIVGSQRCYYFLGHRFITNKRAGSTLV